MTKSSLLHLTVAVVVMVAVPCSSEGTFGVDLAQHYTQEQFQCLVQDWGYTWAVVRAHHSWGGVDTNAPPTIANAWRGGMRQVDVYMFPCTSFNLTAALQVNSTADYLESTATRFGRMWFDIEWNFTPGCDWKLHDPDYNCQFMSALVSAGTARLGAGRLGVYASAAFWDVYMPNCTAAKELPNWYANYDNATNYTDFIPCGGWTAPAVKQYNDNVQGHCNMTGLIDTDWSASFPFVPLQSANGV